MRNKTLYAAWAVLFALCAGLGFIPEPQGFGKAVLVILSLACFVPPFLLLRQGSRNTRVLVRNLSALSLGLTLALLVLNFLSVRLPVAVGDMLYGMLVMVSSPMVCSQFWALSMFLWACLLFTAVSKLKQA